TCRRSDRSTKFATANPSCGGLWYGLICRKLLTNCREIARDAIVKAVIQTIAFVQSAAIAVSLFAIDSVAAQSAKGIELHETAFAFAMQRIKDGQAIADGKGAWTEHRPSAHAENEFIRACGFDEYAKWHLGIDRRFPENSKRRYKFPYGDFKNVHRCGLLAAKARARQYGYAEIENAAAELQRAIKRFIY